MKPSMRWIGTMLHLLYPPRQDATTRALAALLDQTRAARVDIAATRERIEAVAFDLDQAMTQIARDL